MNNKKVLPILGLVLGVVFLFAFFIGTPVNNVDDSNSQEISYGSEVCFFTTGDFEGRNNEPNIGVWEEVECDSNVLYDTGAEAIENLLSVGLNSKYTNITLCNASATCGSPSASASEGWTEYVNSGLKGTEGSKTDNGNGNWTISNTYTASADNLLTNVTRIGNTTGGYLAGNSFTLVTLQTNDQLTVNWTIWVT